MWCHTKYCLGGGAPAAGGAAPAAAAAGGAAPAEEKEEKKEEEKEESDDDMVRHHQNIQIRAWLTFFGSARVSVFSIDLPIFSCPLFVFGRLSLYCRASKTYHIIWLNSLDPSACVVCGHFAA